MSGRIDLKSVRLKTAQKYSNWLLFYLFFQKQAPFSVPSKVEGTDVQVCVTSGKDWKDIAVFKLEEGEVVMLPVESNEFRGERLNRTTWSQLEWLKSFGVNKAVLIDEKDANSLLKKYVTDYFSNH